MGSKIDCLGAFLKPIIIFEVHIKRRMYVYIKTIAISRYYICAYIFINEYLIGKVLGYDYNYSVEALCLEARFIRIIISR